MSPEFPQYLDGPKFITYLKQEGIEKRNLDENEKRRWNDWEAGKRADLYGDCVDNMLTRYGINADHDIPKDVWAADQAHNTGPKKQQKKPKRSRPQRAIRKAKGVQMLLDGEPIPYITTKLGLGKDTAYAWRRELRETGLLTDK